LHPSGVDQIFSAEAGHVPVPLARLAAPRLLWLNRRVMRLDPQFQAGFSEGDYAQHLLRQCAFVVIEEPSSVASDTGRATGMADRYGGTGIGRNGGSGRAVFINGYHLKGVGRTPLVSVLTDRAHASGGAYLEECVREAVLSELVDAEFPSGAVPVLAIIETGEVQVWQTDAGPKPERRCLLVRPAFLRPAHFVRATDFISVNPREGALDAWRVAQTSAAARDFFGQDALTSHWHSFWLRWAEQLAYAYVHRLSHGGNTESNIALDGRLLDFGAMTALPSWARIQTMQGGPPAGLDMLFVVQALQAAAPALARFIDASMASPQVLSALLSQAAAHYHQTVMREVLRVLGLSRLQSARLLQSEQGRPVTAAINRLVMHFAREQFAIFDGMPQPRFAWDLESFWVAEDPPVHARELRGLLDAALRDGPLAGADAAQIRQAVVARSQLRTRTRAGLFRDRIKETLYAELDGRFAGDALTAEEVGRVIDDFVVRHRRDSLAEPEAALPVGFARSHEAGYALFASHSGSELFALQEWHESGQGAPQTSPLPFKVGANDEIEFIGNAMAPARACRHTPAQERAEALLMD
jgi:hypothetical protein